MTSVDEVIRRQAGRPTGRFDPAPGGASMLAVVTRGNGGLEQLEYREVPAAPAGRRRSARPGPGRRRERH